MTHARAKLTIDEHIDTLTMMAEDARYLGNDEKAERLERRAAQLLKQREVAERRVGYESMFAVDLASAGNWR